MASTATPTPVSVRDFQVRRSFTAGFRPPTSLTDDYLLEGEIFINFADKVICAGRGDGTFTETSLDPAAGGDTIAVPDAANDGTTAHAGTLPNPRKLKGIPRDKPLSIFWWLDPTREYGLRNGTDTATCQAALASAVASGENIDLGVGTYKVTDKLTLVRQGQKLIGASRMSYPGSPMGASLSVGQDFNMAATSVLQPTFENEISDFAFDFYQPTITNISQLIQYPWALDIRNASRAKIRRLRMNRAWNGINGIVRTGTDTGGANTIVDMELGCFNYPFYFDAFNGDFLELDRFRCWVFGFADRADLQSAYYGGGSIGYTNPTAVFGQQDGLTVGSLSMWKTKLIYQNGSSLHGVIANLNMDGGGSYIECRQGNLSLGNLTSLTDSPVASLLVNNTLAQVQIGNARINSLGDFGNRALVEISAGELQIGALATQTAADTRHILQTGGDLEIGNWRPRGITNTTRSRAMCEKSGGRLSINFRPQDIGTGSGAVLTSTIDDFDRISGHRVGWAVNLPLTQNNAIINIK